MLDIDDGIVRYRDSLAGYLNSEFFSAFQCIGKSTNLLDKLLFWIVFFDISGHLDINLTPYF